MKGGITKNKIVWTIGAGIALFVGFLLCRYAFFGLHGMISWPIYLFMFGLIAIIIAAFFDARKVMVCTTVGYIVGVALGMIFRVDGVDPGGGSTNNAWVIWTISFFIIILMGIIWDLLTKFIKKENKH